MFSHRENKFNKVHSDFMYQCWQEKNLDSIPHFMSEKTLIESPLKTTVGYQHFQNVLSFWLRAFPTLCYKEVDRTFYNKELRIRWQVQAQHLGEFYALSATGAQVKYQGVTSICYQDNKVIKYYADVDVDSILKQINNRHQKQPSKVDNNLYLVVLDFLTIKLSSRQIQCISLLFLHLTHKEIASLLNIAPSSVKTHLMRACDKLAVSNTHGLIQYFTENHLVEILLRIGLQIKSQYRFT